jgi:hypothetical protein
MRLEEPALNEHLTSDAAFVNNFAKEMEDALGLVISKKRKLAEDKSFEIKLRPKKIKDCVNLPTAEILENQLRLAAQKLDIGNIKTNLNSEKATSVSFEKHDKKYDVVIVRGANEGEIFEKELFSKLKKYAKDPIKNAKVEEAKNLFNAIKNAIQDFDISQIKEIRKRSGQTSRANIPAEKIGEVVADIIVELQNETCLYLSIKNQTGDTFANIGMKRLFTEQLAVNKSNSLYEMLREIGVNFSIFSKGLKSYRDEKVMKPITDSTVRKIPIDSAFYDFMIKSWGFNYLYVRNVGTNFKVLKMDKEFVHDILLKDLCVSEICYPHTTSKQLKIKLSNEFASYIIEIRNTKGEIKPTEMKVKIVKTPV